jgi:hypothetical protein
MRSTGATSAEYPIWPLVDFWLIFSTGVNRLLTALGRVFAYRRPSGDPQNVGLDGSCVRPWRATEALTDPGPAL